MKNHLHDSNSNNDSNIYSNILDDFERYEPQLKEAFLQISKGNPKIKSEHFDDVILDFGVIVAHDVEEARQWFSPQNKIIASKYDLSELTFKEFCEILKNWLAYKSQDKLDNVEKQSNQILRDESEDNHAKSNSNSAKVEPNDNQNNPKFTPSEKKSMIPMNYNQNKKKIDEALSLKYDEIEENFRARIESLEQKGNELSLSDCFPFLQETFEICGLELIENIDDMQDFFQKVNSYRTFSKKLKDYAMETRNISNDSLQKDEEIKISFNELFDFMNNWLKIDPEIMILTKIERKAKGINNPIILSLMKTIENYQKLLSVCSSEKEREILSNTIETLKKQIDSLENTIKADTKDIPSTIPDNEKGGQRDQEASNNNNNNNIRFDLQKRKKILAKIYNYYCKMRTNTHKATTFENIEYDTALLNLNKIIIFCRDFQLYNKRLDPPKMIELFKKIALNNRELTVEKFEELLEKMAMISYHNDPQYNAEADKIRAFYEHMGVYNGEYQRKLQNKVLVSSSLDKEISMQSPKPKKRILKSGLQLIKGGVNGSNNGDNGSNSAGNGVDSAGSGVSSASNGVNTAGNGGNSISNSVGNGINGGNSNDDDIQLFKRKFQSKELKKQITQKKQMKDQNPNELKKIEERNGSKIEKIDLKKKLDLNLDQKILESPKKNNFIYIGKDTQQGKAKGEEEEFDPNDLLDNTDDYDDQFYLAEYNLGIDKRINHREDKINIKRKEENVKYEPNLTVDNRNNNKEEKLKSKRNQDNTKSEPPTPLKYYQIHLNKAKRIQDLNLNKHENGSKYYLNTSHDIENSQITSNLMAEKYLFPGLSRNQQISDRLNHSEILDNNKSMVPMILDNKVNGRNVIQREFVSNKSIDRANKLDQMGKIKEQQHIKAAMLLQENQMRKGMNVLSKIK